ncbi:hypothetical protein [Amycolatopsis sp. H20-H5]|uniref:hypothetical protein n=1 Tax=Amycolatopsis sp. H20-H5 TaxID=3046309 RepID=UPI002DB5A58C|nr:hypothetical protein [Amycolatopsis sp. H20-H5]MEC3979982.1 hypothetical protein [Amycolatopsis sp. H20-H5]
MGKARGILVLTVGVVVVAVGIWAGQVNSGSQVPAPSVTAPQLAPVAADDHLPVSAADYQRALTAFDDAVRPGAGQVDAARTVAELNAANARLSQVLRAQADKLGALVPPDAVAAEHEQLRRSLYELATAFEQPTRPSTPNECGVSPPVSDAVRASVRALSLGQSSLGKAAAAFAAHQFRVGTSLPKVPTAAPSPPEDRRAANGKIVERSGPRGRGRLEITNGLTRDVAVSVVTGDPAKPQVMIYVRVEAKATISGITGTYQVYFKSGTDWDGARHGFTSGCTFEKFEDIFDQQSDWQIDLAKSPVGNAHTSTVGRY